MGQADEEDEGHPEPVGGCPPWEPEDPLRDQEIGDKEGEEIGNHEVILEGEPDNRACLGGEDIFVAPGEEEGHGIVKGQGGGREDGEEDRVEVQETDQPAEAGKGSQPPA